MESTYVFGGTVKLKLSFHCKSETRSVLGTSARHVSINDLPTGLRCISCVGKISRRGPIWLCTRSTITIIKKEKQTLISIEVCWYILLFVVGQCVVLLSTENRSEIQCSYQIIQIERENQLDTGQSPHYRMNWHTLLCDATFLFFICVYIEDTNVPVLRNRKP